MFPSISIFNQLNSNMRQKLYKLLCINLFRRQIKQVCFNNKIYKHIRIFVSVIYLASCQHRLVLTAAGSYNKWLLPCDSVINSRQNLFLLLFFPKYGVFVEKQKQSYNCPECWNKKSFAESMNSSKLAKLFSL